MVPLVYGSENNLITSVYEKDNKRAMIDGAFTRLFCRCTARLHCVLCAPYFCVWRAYRWGECAGTERFIQNCAAWLANREGRIARRGKVIEGARVVRR